MATSEVSICNLALSSIGADSIRSFDEDNKRSRQCKNFYDYTKVYLLARFDWPFARKFSNLQEINTENEDVPEGEHAFQLPADCRTPRDIHPPGSSTPWRMAGNRLYTPLASVGLYYTQVSPDVSLFSDTFANILALALAVRLAPIITQDKELAKTLYARYYQELMDCEEADANIGNEYRAFDENPDFDPFVTGEPVVPICTDRDWAT